MNIDNLKKLAGVLRDLPEGRKHTMYIFVSECGTSACTLGHGAMSDVPELLKGVPRCGISGIWDDAVNNWFYYGGHVYDIQHPSAEWDFLFGACWPKDTVSHALRRVEHVIEHGSVPVRRDWHKWES